MNVLAFADTYTRSDNVNLGAAYDQGYTSLGNLQIVGGRLRPVTLGLDCLATINSPILPSDQWASCVIPTVDIVDGPQAVLLVLRWSDPPNTNGYQFVAITNSGSTTTAFIAIVQGNTQALLVSAEIGEWASGDVLGAEAVGQTLNLYKNGALVLTTTDSIFPSGGRAGVWMYTTTAAGMEADNVQAGPMLQDIEAAKIADVVTASLFISAAVTLSVSVGEPTIGASAL